MSPRYPISPNPMTPGVAGPWDHEKASGCSQHPEAECQNEEP